MIKISNVQVFNFEGALRGLRNPLDSWKLSDSKYPIIIQTDEDSLQQLAEETAELFEEKMKKNEQQLFNEVDSQSLIEYIKDQATKEALLRGQYYNAAFIGPNDLNLAQRMIAAGTDESKFMRQILVTMDIELPLFVWKEVDTYKVGTTANSCSTMHKLCSSPITEKNFSFGTGEFSLGELNTDDYLFVKDIFNDTIEECEKLRQKYLEYLAKAKDSNPEEAKLWRKRANIIWRTLIEVLPNGWMQKRTVTLNYQVLRAMYFARRNHKLVEWREFCDYIKAELPYAEELICYERSKK